MTSTEVLTAGSFGEIIKPYKQPLKGKVSDVVIKDLLPVNVDTRWLTCLNNIWLVSSRISQNACNWQGFMSKTANGPFQCSTIIYNPMVPLNPSTWEAVYSTMVFIKKQAENVGQHCAILTFDQPLYYKAYCVKQEHDVEFQNMFVRLGGFHQLMSFLGAGMICILLMNKKIQVN